MSYDIGSWRTKELTDLRIPIAALYPEGKYHDWLNQPQSNGPSGEVVIYGMSEDGIKIHGVLADGVLQVTEIDVCGEASGTTYREILWAAFEQSTGTLVSVCVWKEGDSIKRLEVRDGQVDETEIEF